MVKLRYFFSAALFQILGGLMILFGLVVLVSTQVIDTSFARPGFVVGFPLAIAGGIFITIANLRGPKNRRARR